MHDMSPHQIISTDHAAKGPSLEFDERIDLADCDDDELEQVRLHLRQLASLGLYAAAASGL
jgi:hypothetical protein